MKRKPFLKRKERVEPQQTTEPSYEIPFTIPEIDTVMQSLIEANIPIQTYILLDQKFQPAKLQSAQIDRREGGGIIPGGVLTFNSKMNEEGAVAIEEFNETYIYGEGDAYYKKTPGGGKRVYKIMKGDEIEITTNEDLAGNGSGEINKGD